MIECRQISKTYRTAKGDVRSLDTVDLDVRKGEFISVRGPSGCGKTTLLLLLGGMLRPTAGTARVDGRDLYSLTGPDRARFRRDSIGFVFQMFHLVPYLSVLDNVVLAAPPGDRTATRRHAESLLTDLGLAPRLQHRPAELSAGERQRTAIARALLNQPKVILADEPTGNLDPENAAEVFQHLAAYHRAGGTVVVVTHGTVADTHADRVIQMKSGKILN